MALRLRRGTNAERLLVTPLEGELIYTTDTKILYIGDGVTQGGLQVTGAFPESINDLNDVDIASLAPEVGQVLKWNGIEFIPADLIEVGEQANIDIIADDSTILIDSETQNIQGNIFTGDTFVGNLFNGTFVGDGSGLTNLPIATDGSGIVLGSNYRINIAADDSTILVDSSTGTHRGFFEGELVGPVFGSVYSFDSSTIIDSFSKTGFLNTLKINEVPLVGVGPNSLNIGNGENLVDLTISVNSTTRLRSDTSNVTSPSSLNILEIQSYNGTEDTPTDVNNGDILGVLAFSGYYNSNFDISSIITAYVNDLDLSNGLNSNIIIGNTSEAFIRSGRYIEHNGLTHVTSVYALKVGSFSTGSEPSTPEEGTIIFDTTTKKFKGWDGTGWIDFH